MYILYFLLSLGTFIASMLMKVTVGGVAFLLIMAFLFLFLGAWDLLSKKVGGQRRSERHIISPDELRAYREQAEQAKARKAAESEQSTPQ